MVFSASQTDFHGPKERAAFPQKISCRPGQRSQDRFRDSYCRYRHRNAVRSPALFYPYFMESGASIHLREFANRIFLQMEACGHSIEIAGDIVRTQ